MNCPGHMLLFGETLRSYRELPLRYAEAAPLHRNELAGALHGLTRVRHVTQDDAHIFCTQEQIPAELDGCIDYLRYPLRPLRAGAARGVLDAPGRQARQRRGVGLRRGRARGGARAKRDRVRRRRRRRLLLRAEDRPARDRRARPLVAARNDPARPADAAAVRPYLYGAGQHGASGVRHPPCALRIVRALHRHPDRALRAAPSRSGSRRCRSACCRSARAISRPRSAIVERLREAGYRVDVGEPTETIGKRIRAVRAREDPVHDRLRRPGERAEPRNPRARGRADRGIARGFAREACYA